MRADFVLYATVYGRRRTLRVPYARMTAAGSPWGTCGTGELGNAAIMWCRSAYTMPFWTRVRLHDRETGATSPLVWNSAANFAPFHVNAGISPLNTHFSRFSLGKDWDAKRLSVTDVEFVGLEPLDHVIRPVRFDNIRLEEWEAVYLR